MRKLKYFYVKAGGTVSQLPLPFEMFLFLSVPVRDQSSSNPRGFMNIYKKKADSWQGSDFSKVKLHMTIQKNTNKIQRIN